MKNLLAIFTAAASIAFGLTLPSYAQTITATSLGNLSKVPGSSADFSLFGNPSQFTYNIGGNGMQPTTLTNFTVAADDGGATANGGYSGDSTVTSPAGDSVFTGTVFMSYATDPLLNLTLGNSSNPNSTFDYSNFYVIAMYGNSDVDGTDNRDASIALGGSSGTTTEIVADTNTSDTLASFVEFHVSGYSSGDVLTLNALPAIGSNVRYLGGVSFSQEAVDVPEPSTFGLMGLGLGSLLLLASLLRSNKLQTV